MGDDLNFAQRFTKTAADGLSILAEMSDPRADSELLIVTDMMATLQRGAKRLRARHIYTGAQDVLTALHHEDDNILTGRIQSLGSVVTEYARGLEELVAAPKLSSRPVSNTDKWDTARETLNALLPISPPEEADVLSRLMRAPVTLAEVQPDFSAEENVFGEGENRVVPFAIPGTKPAEIAISEDDLLADFAAENQATENSVKADITAKKPNLPMIQLDAMMRDVVADALSVARTSGRTISLSYDMGDRSEAEDVAENLRQRLGQALSQIIRQALPEGRVGHIDVNLAGEQLHIMAGTTALRLLIDPKTTPAKKPLITAETEQGLRAQLNALLDPISMQDTAS